MKIRTGDKVVVISGSCKGKTGQVLRVLSGKNRIVVADVNMRTKHVRKGPNRPGEIVKYEASIHTSNVMLIDPKSGKRTRAGFSVSEDGKKKRIAKRSGEEISASAVSGKKHMRKKDEPVVAKSTSVKKSDEAAKIEAKTDSGTRTKSRIPFWKKMGFGADELDQSTEAGSEPRMKEDHSVPEQIERISNRGSQRGS